MIGTLGDVTFEASNNLVRTFTDFQRSGGDPQYAEHQRIGAKSLLEFVSPGLDSISFKMQFSVEMHTNPREEIELLRTIRDGGIVSTLILDGVPLGDFVITGLSEEWSRVDNTGFLRAAEVSVNLKEYARIDE